MNELINWIARNNTLMIQSGFTIVLLLVVIYIYRLFFVSTNATAQAQASGDVGQINQKIDQLLQQQKVATASRPVSTNPELEQNTSAELEQLRAELTEVRKALNESEKKVFDMTPSAGTAEAVQTPVTEASVASVSESSEKVGELSEKIKQLESRLAEYDIIADDIAELSQLRAENADLKKKLGSTTEVPPVATVTEAPAVEESVAAEPAVAVEAEATTETTEVSETDKNAMSDFENLMKKGSS